MSGLSMAGFVLAAAFCQALQRFATLKKQRAAQYITRSPSRLAGVTSRRRPYVPAPFLLIYGLLETLACGEGRHRLRGDPDLLPRRGTAARARLALARQASAKADHGDALALRDVLHDRIEHRVHRVSCRRLAEITGLCRNLDEVLFGYHRSEE